MKKMITTTLITILSSAAIACPGGSLVQLIERGATPETSTIIASFQIQTGERIVSSKSLMVLAVYDSQGQSLCADESCSTLKAFKDENIVARYIMMGKEKVRSISLNDLSMGPDVPVAKSVPFGLPKDSEGNTIFTCAK
jgi:hypothetical protein